MALQGRQTTGLLPRQLQEGLDLTIDECQKHMYMGAYSKIFPKVSHHKAFYEIMKMAGMGVAGLLGEGEPIENYDTLDQHWVYTAPLLTYEKSMRITHQAIEFNRYMDLIGRGGKELTKAHDTRKDIECANIFNNGFDNTITYGDEVEFFSNSHPIQAGGTVDNLATGDFDEDLVEAMRTLIHQMKNDDGLYGDYEPDKLIYPIQLEHDVLRVMKSTLTPATANNAINVNKYMGDINELVPWKQLTDSDAVFLTTNYSDGICFVEHSGIQTRNFEKDWDIVLSSISTWRPVVKDAARAAVASQG